MTEDQRKKYEEAAKVVYPENTLQHLEARRGYIYAHSQAQIQIDSLLNQVKIRDQELEQRVKQAHNAAIDKATETLKANWFSAKCHDLFNVIQKLKL